MTEVIKEAVEALHAALSYYSSIGNFRVGTPAEVIKHLNAKGFTITRAETSPSDTTYPAPNVEIPDGFKYTAAQQAVWDWWCEHQKAPPVCDDLNNLIWKLEKLKSEPSMSEAELELEAFQLAVDIWECGAERDRKNDTDKCKQWIVELAKKYRGM